MPMREARLDQNLMPAHDRHMNLRYALLVVAALFAAAATLLIAAGSTTNTLFVVGGTLVVVGACLLALTALAARWRMVDVRLVKRLRDSGAADASDSFYDDLLPESFDDSAGDFGDVEAV